MDKTITQSLSDWLAAHQEEMLSDIAGLVAIPTIVNEGEAGYPYGHALKEAILYMGKLAEKYGFTWHNHDWHCVSIQYGEGDKQLGIWGHLDVVPLGDDWIYPPFDCTRVHNFLIGRGVQDNKAPCIASLYVLRYLKDHKLHPDFQIRLIYGCQEETGMQDVAEYLKREMAPDFSLVPDCGFPVCFGEKGILEVTLTSEPLSSGIASLSGGQAANMIPSEGYAEIYGKTYHTKGIAGHSAYPEGTVNAFCSLGKKLEALSELTDKEKMAFQFLALAAQDGYGRGLCIDRTDEISGDMTCSPTLLSLESGRMKLTMNIRYPITSDGQKILQDLGKKAAAYGLSIENAHDNKPNYVDPMSPWVQFLAQACAEATGSYQPPYIMSGGTYARKLPNAVGFGVGLPRDISVLGLPEGHGEYHQPDESQCTDNLWEAWRIYTYTICKLVKSGFPE